MRERATFRPSPRTIFTDLWAQQTPTPTTALVFWQDDAYLWEHCCGSGQRWIWSQSTTFLHCWLIGRGRLLCGLSFQSSLKVCFICKLLVTLAMILILQLLRGDVLPCQIQAARWCVTLHYSPRLPTSELLPLESTADDRFPTFITKICQFFLGNARKMGEKWIKHLGAAILSFHARSSSVTYILRNRGARPHPTTSEVLGLIAFLCTGCQQVILYSW